jgi:hypothetical protein
MTIVYDSYDSCTTDLFLNSIYFIFLVSLISKMEKRGGGDTIDNSGPNNDDDRKSLTKTQIAALHVSSRARHARARAAGPCYRPHFCLHPASLALIIIIFFFSFGVSSSSSSICSNSYRNKKPLARYGTGTLYKDN